MKKMNLKYGEIVRLKNTGTDLDSLNLKVVGKSNEFILDTYIVKFCDEKIRNNGVDSFDTIAIIESCLERI